MRDDGEEKDRKEKNGEEKADPWGKGGLRDFNFVVTLWRASGLKG
jgi:hypothetical protein